MTRRLFPGCWDLIGGHVEDGEEVLSALRREIHEETGWILKAVVHELAAKHWNDGPTEYEERQFIAGVEGELRNPCPGNEQSIGICVGRSRERRKAEAEP